MQLTEFSMESQYRCIKAQTHVYVDICFNTNNATDTYKNTTGFPITWFNNPHIITENTHQIIIFKKLQI